MKKRSIKLLGESYTIAGELREMYRDFLQRKADLLEELANLDNEAKLQSDRALGRLKRLEGVHGDWTIDLSYYDDHGEAFFLYEGSKDMDDGYEYLLDDDETVH